MAIVFLDGQFCEEHEAKIFVLDAGFLYGEAIYETLRTHGGKVFNASAHLERLNHSAKLLSIPLSSLNELEGWIQETVDRNGFWAQGRESRIRITVSGGVHELDEEAQKSTILIAVTPLVELTPEERLRGVSVITFEAERVLPEAKTTNLVPVLLARRSMRAQKADEVLLVGREGCVTEGSVSNFFVVEKGVLITPEASILAGTTRAEIFKLAQQLGIEVREDSIFKNRLYSADELLICNAPRGILPVTQVDDRAVGGGRVGKITQTLIEHFIF